MCNIYIYIYINIYMVIIKHSFTIMVAYTTITTIYNCNLSFLHAFVVMCYLPKLRRGMASSFLNKFQYQT